METVVQKLQSATYNSCSTNTNVQNFRIVGIHDSHKISKHTGVVSTFENILKSFVNGGDLKTNSIWKQYWVFFDRSNDIDLILGMILTRYWAI